MLLFAFALVMLGAVHLPAEYTDWEIGSFRDVRSLTNSDRQVRVFAVKVAGQNLAEKHICPGDVMVCRVTSRYEEGRIGIWQTPAGRTAKFAHFIPDGGVILHNESGWQEWQKWQVEDVRLLGIVVRVERDLE